MKYQQPIDIIQSIINRYEIGMPQIFKRINEYEKELINDKPRHVLSISDCMSIVNQNNNYKKFNFEIRIVSNCVLSLYKWYKSKVIYVVNDSILYDNNNPIIIDKRKLELFPYSGIYIKTNFYRSKYVGCFITTTKEKEEYSLRKYLIVSFVEYDESKNKYFLEPFLLSIKDGISVEESFMLGLENDGIGTHNLNENIKSSEMAVNILYYIIDSVNLKKINKSTKSIARNVHETKISIKNNKTYRISYSTKYKYEIHNSATSTGSPKSPHTRRSHTRTLKVRDKDGNIVSTKTIIIPESHIHENKEKVTSIKVLSSKP